MYAALVRFVCLSLLLLHHILVLTKIAVVQLTLQHTVHPHLEIISRYGPRYITIVNFEAQTIYIFITLIVFAVSKFSETIAWKLDKWNTLFYYGCVVTYTMVTFVTFWPVFLYDRELVYPKIMDDHFPIYCNTSTHAAILVLPFLEAIFVCKKPLPWKAIIKPVWFFMLIMGFIPLYTFYADNVWIYGFHELFNRWQFVLAYTLQYVVAVSSAKLALRVQKYNYSRSIAMKEM